MDIQNIGFYLLIAFLFQQIRNEEKTPKFCETSHFDTMFYIGFNLSVQTKISGSAYWTWTWDYGIKEFREPPVKTDITKGDSIISTGFLVTLVPPCANSDPNYCDHINRAKDLFFVRYFGQKAGEEPKIETKVFRLKGGIEVKPNDYPWNLTANTLADIWPKQWNSKELEPIASLFNEPMFEIYYIVNSGHENTSAIVWSEISTIDWYKHQKEVALKSRVRFVGMFFIEGKVYAVGDRPLDNDFETKIYIMERYGDNREFKPINMPFRQWFRCKPTTTPTTEYSSSESTKPKLMNVNKDSADTQLLIVIVFVIIFVIIIVILILGFVFLKFRGEKDPKSTNESKTGSDETVSRTPSIVTINSTTGEDIRTVSKSSRR